MRVLKSILLAAAIFSVAGAQAQIKNYSPVNYGPKDYGKTSTLRITPLPRTAWE